MMTGRTLIDRMTQQETLNFLLTNRIPRRLATQFMGWFSRIERPWVRDASIAIWRLFSDLDLSEAKKSTFKSMRDCFTRELKEGVRPIDRDPTTLVSPCDAIVGACACRHRTAADQEASSIRELTTMATSKPSIATAATSRCV
jgi:phosphatidylserine decarboxylase